MFFNGCSFKNSCFSELAYKSNVLVHQTIIICSLLFKIQKRCSYLENFALDFVLLVLKLYPMQVVISLPLWTKLTVIQLLLLFLCNFCSFQLRWSCPSKQLPPTFFHCFSYLGNYNTRRVFVIIFDLQRSSKLPQKRRHHSYNNRKWLKHSQGHFGWAIPHSATLFPLFVCIFCMATPDISSSSTNINNAVYPDYLSVCYDYEHSFHQN